MRLLVALKVYGFETIANVNTSYYLIGTGLNTLYHYLI